MQQLEDCIVGPDATIADAMETIDKSKAKIALVVNEKGVFLGTATDGDLRRGLLAGAVLMDSVLPLVNRSPRTASSSHDNDELLNFMRAEQIRHVPIVDGSGRLVGLRTLTELVTAKRRPNWVLLMAGGEGQRLRPLTAEVPKPMLQVGTKPILETIITSLAKEGFYRFFLSVNYKANVIEEYFGNGRQFGVEISYLRETEPLGTGGAIGLLPEQPVDPILVMNGDILTNINFSSVLDFHEEQEASATMCVREFQFQVPYGVVDIKDNRLHRFVEKPVHRSYVNAGIYVVSPHALSLVDGKTPFTMPELFESLMAQSENCSVYPVKEYWLDIGQHDDLARAQREFGDVFE
jgi:dTDP-glucose pyrophosphorylase